MQRIANEMALPETTFVFPPDAPKTDARIYISLSSRAGALEEVRVGGEAVVVGEGTVRS
jgi:predicted PhzF superfamily epimerase YddE/YHI9